MRKSSPDLALVRAIELAIAQEAATHASATKALNPYSEAEFRDIGAGVLVYAGVYSPFNGAYAFGLDGEPEERDAAEAQRFFADRDCSEAYWHSPLTPASLAAHWRKHFRVTQQQSIAGAAIEGENPWGNKTPGSSTPSLDDWALAFTRREKPEAKEPSLLALTKLHQAETRFYLHEESAGYTFFHRGVAWIPFPNAALSALQWRDAKEFGARWIGLGRPLGLPLLYERTRYESGEL